MSRRGRLAAAAVLLVAIGAGPAPADPAPAEGSAPSAAAPGAATPQPPPEAAPAPPPPAPAKPPTEPAPPKNPEPIGTDQAIGILGKDVKGPDGKQALGKVVDVLVDANGVPQAAVVDFGGFLGVGSRKIAVDWRLLQFRPADHQVPIALSVDRTELQAAPEYKDSTQPTAMVGPPDEAPAPAPADGPR